MGFLTLLLYYKKIVITLLETYAREEKSCIRKL